MVLTTETFHVAFNIHSLEVYDDDTEIWMNVYSGFRYIRGFGEKDILQR